ncbi:MAG: hypothetical protein K0R68_2298, partial [Mycobacterium sp.]|nr:hypothetical protein [Mycobacterium sp.]MDF2824890.1 hypothetical protein [Mycobacterium sp.]
PPPQAVNTNDRLATAASPTFDLKETITKLLH